MAIIHTSKIAPVAEKLKFKGVLEAAYLIRFALDNKSNAEIRHAMRGLFGPHWDRANQQRRYYNLLRSYVRQYHDADYMRYLLKEDIQLRPQDQKGHRQTLVRYLITQHGLHGASEVVNDLG